MNHVMSIFAILILCYATAIQSVAQKKTHMRVVKNFSPLSPVTVILTQIYNGARDIVKFHRNTDKFRLCNGMITIQAEMNICGTPKTYIYPKPLCRWEIAGKEIHIEKTDSEAGFEIRLKPICRKKLVVSKQKN